MGYTSTDFEESMRISGVDLTEIKSVIWAIGNTDKDGQCCEECGGEWSGEFAFEMNDGRYGVVSGWCDYTGWGCQDGAGVDYFDTKPEAPKFADKKPADLNWLLKEAKKSAVQSKLLEES